MANFKIHITPGGGLTPHICEGTTLDPCYVPSGDLLRAATYGRVFSDPATPSPKHDPPPCGKVIDHRRRELANNPKSTGGFGASVRCGRVEPPLPPCPVPPPACPVWKGKVHWCQPELDCGSDPTPPPPPPRCYTEAELEGTGWGYCPPCGDYRDLIRPLDPNTPSSQRPTGKPYFNVGARDCEEVQVPLACKAKKFTFCDWMDTVADREPPPSLQCQCLPSLCYVCEPVYKDCCPQTENPQNYTLTRAT